MSPEHQLSFWEDPKQIILEREKVDLSTLKTLKTRKLAMDKIPKEKYYIYKTGGINPFMTELGPIFPFIKNDRGKIMNLVPQTNGKDAPYPHLNIFIMGNANEKPNSLKCYMHKLVGLAFLKNNDFENKYIIDHLNGNILDYRPENLEWVTPSQNSLRRKK